MTHKFNIRNQNLPVLHYISFADHTTLLAKAEHSMRVPRVHTQRAPAWTVKLAIRMIWTGEVKEHIDWMYSSPGTEPTLGEVLVEVRQHNGVIRAAMKSANDT